ncbi:MAG: HAD-IIB family hydrolase [Clostridia bacterium]|nr:HAD-IIB family hydrolase [Clostridia bacterium]
MYSPEPSQKKILASDFDGTFFLNYDDMRRNIVEVDKFRKEGNIFVIATGRSYLGLDVELMKNPVDCDYYVLNHGATIITQNDEIIEEITLDEKTKKSILLDLQAMEPATKAVAYKGLKTNVDIEEKGISKIQKVFANLELAQKANEEINERYSNKAISYLVASTNSIEIVSAKANKAKAMKLIAGLENVSSKSIYTVGDSMNDLEMIKKFNGYCMVNAEENVKTVCSARCRSVAELIEKIRYEAPKKHVKFM